MSPNTVTANATTVNTITVDQPPWGRLTIDYSWEFSGSGTDDVVESQGSGFDLKPTGAVTQSGGYGVFTSGYYQDPAVNPVLFASTPFILLVRWNRTAPDTNPGWFDLAAETDDPGGGAPSLEWAYGSGERLYMYPDSTANTLWGGWYWTFPTGTFADGEWHEMVFTYNGNGPTDVNNFSPVIDGVAPTSSTPYTAYAGAWRTFVGRGSFANSDFIGSIDYIRVQSTYQYADDADAANVLTANATTTNVLTKDFT